jgi:hypothetical protein
MCKFQSVVDVDIGGGAVCVPGLGAIMSQRWDRACPWPLVKGTTW